MDELTDEEVVVITAAISAYLHDEKKEFVPISKWKIVGRKENIGNRKKVMIDKKWKFSVDSRWRVAGRLELMKKND